MSQSEKSPLANWPFIVAVLACLAVAWMVFDKYLQTRAAEKRITQLNAEMDRKSEKLNAGISALDKSAAELKEGMSSDKQYREMMMKAAARGGAVGSALASASVAKPAVVEFFMSNGKWPTNNEEAGMSPPSDYALGHIKSIAVEAAGETAAVRVRFLDESKTIKNVLLTAFTNPAGQVGWRCSSPDVASFAQTYPDCAAGTR
jgi:Pilin (bacterial filament)